MSRSLFPSASLIAALALSGASPARAGDTIWPAERYSVRTSHSDIKAGGARIDVHAPADAVQKLVLDFGHYADHIKKFEKARVVGRHGDSTDVYLEVPIMKGAAKIWGIVRFEPARTGPSGETLVSGTLVRGNVKRMDAWWRITRVDDHKTDLHLELLIVPDLPIPGSLVTGEAAYASEMAIKGIWKTAEGG